MSPERISGVVLAGGRSTRFGRNKLAEPVGSGTLLDRALDALDGLCTDVALVIGTDALEPPVRQRGLATLRVVRDPELDRGPVLGLVTGLEAAPNPVVLVVAGDMPSLVADVLQLLAEEIAAGAAAAVLEDGGRSRPLPAAFDRARGLEAGRRALDGGREPSLRSVLDALDAVVVPEAAWRAHDPEGATLRDVDRPKDLDGLS